MVSPDFEGFSGYNLHGSLKKKKKTSLVVKTFSYRYRLSPTAVSAYIDAWRWIVASLDGGHMAVYMGCAFCPLSSWSSLYTYAFRACPYPLETPDPWVCWPRIVILFLRACIIPPGYLSCSIQSIQRLTDTGAFQMFKLGMFDLCLC